MNYYDLAIKRKSTRSFRNKAAEDYALQVLISYFTRCQRLLPDVHVEMKLLEADAFLQISGCAGYYGYMIEAPHYLLLLSEAAPYALENAGYIGEDLVLKLTDLEMATCWLTITEPEELRQRICPDSDLHAAALIAFGYEKPARDSIRLDIKSPSNVILKKRSGLVAPKLYIEDAVYEGQWGVKSDVSGWSQTSNIYRAFVAACCAPSALNRQPYRFLKDKNRVYLVLLNDELTISSDIHLNAGIVMLHFAAVCGYQNTLHGSWVLESPEKEYILPEGARILGYFEI